MTVEELIALINAIDETLSYVDPDQPGTDPAPLETYDYITAIQRARALIQNANPDGNR